MKSTQLALMVVGYLALSNKAMKGQKIPSLDGSIEFSGDEIATGSLATVAAFLLILSTLIALFETIREWQSRTAPFSNQDEKSDSRLEDLGIAFSPIFTNPIIYFCIFVFNYWIPVAFGIFVIYKLNSEISIFISRVFI